MFRNEAVSNWRAGLVESCSKIFKRIHRQHLFLIFGAIISILVITKIFRASDQPPGLHTPGQVGSGSGQGLAEPSAVHPIDQLVSQSRSKLAQLKSRQSKSLVEAVAEYERRYNSAPPPNFNEWYIFAVENGIQLIDEYDAIHDMLLPFWAYSPAALRRKAKTALGADDFLMGLFVRDGTVKAVQNGPQWKLDTMKRAVEPFARFLPDMDVVFNLHDEPRVVLPHEDLNRLLQRAYEVRGSLKTQPSPRNVWSSRPPDVNEGFLEPYGITVFNEYAHQFTWSVSRLSCPLDSPAKALDYDGFPCQDKSVAYSVEPLGFIQNRTAFTDVCLSPSLEQNYGFFNKPNAWCVTHDLIPIFSPSKISSFQDILFPAPWYLADKVVFDDSTDFPWEEKENVMYWRGSTTSGYSEDGIWRRQHRQRFVEQVEKPGPGKILHLDQGSAWIIKPVERESFNHLFNVHFSYVGQCSEADCAEQMEYFDVHEKDDFEAAWKYKYLLDIDGNAFSGRFYAFLQSRSLVFKLALFREWHEERVMPWVHYIPLSLNGSEHLETMRYLAEEEKGMKYAKEIAQASREWAGNALRKVDMEAWLFRVLLEYGRLVDDARADIGFKL